MTQSTTPDFEDLETEEANTVSTEDDVAEDVDLDVDVDAMTADEVPDEETDVIPEAPATAAKPAKAEKQPAREPAPEGYITPVAFAKVLTAHLAELGVSNKHGRIDVKTNVVPPQMVYSYLNNANKTGAKNPWPTYVSTPEGVFATGSVPEGSKILRENLLIAKESLAWWDAMRERTQERSANAAAKAAKAAEKAKAAQAEAAAAPAETVPVVEAE